MELPEYIRGMHPDVQDAYRAEVEHLDEDLVKLRNSSMLAPNTAILIQILRNTKKDA